MKKTLLCLLVLLLALCVLVACNDTPPNNDGNHNDTSQGGSTDGGTDGGNTPPPADPVPVVTEKLCGKTARELYEAADSYLASLVNATQSLNLKMTVEQGESRIVVNNQTLGKISGKDTYVKTDTEALGEHTVTEETYIGGLLYENDGTYKTVTAVGDDYDHNFSGTAIVIGDDDIKSITLYEFEGDYYLILDVDTEKVKELLEFDLPAYAEVTFEELFCRVDLTDDGVFRSMAVSIKGSSTKDGEIARAELQYEITISNVGMTSVSAPADADEYVFYDPDFDSGDGDGDDGEELVTIFFDTDGGRAVDPITEYAGTPISAPTSPLKLNYDFIGWYTEDGEPYTFTVMPDEDLVLYAHYRRERCTITFVTNGGSAVAPITGAPGTPILPPDAPTKPYADFLGWYTANNLPYTFTVMPEEDLVLYAKYYEKSSIVVTFKYVDKNGNPMEFLEDGTTEYKRTVGKGGTVIAPALVDDSLAFEDYVIIGWDSNGDKVADELWRSATNDLTVTSLVRDKAYFSVKFYREDGTTLYKELRVKEGKDVYAYDVGEPVEAGKCFKKWVKISGKSSIALIEDDCAFKASYTVTDGTIGKVAPGSIKVDGIKEPAYATDGTGSGAYLPLNAMQQADHVQYQGAPLNADDINAGGTRGVPTVRSDASLVWDGEYIYLFVEVYDKTLLGRSAIYTKAAADAYLQDTIEVRYTFEQLANAGNNYTRLGVVGVRNRKLVSGDYESLCYASPRSAGIGFGRSTHYDQTLIAVRSALDTYEDPVFDGVFDPAGRTKPSYVVEIAFPAYTEGTADMSVWGIDPATGRKPNAHVSSNDPADYAFTQGEKLVAGDYVRFSLQVNDLMLGATDIAGKAGSIFADCPASVLGFGNSTYLFYVDARGDLLADSYGRPIEAEGGDAALYGKFSASGHTQMDTNYYIMLTLGDTENSLTKIWGLSGKNVNRKFYSDKECTQVYVRPVN